MSKSNILMIDKFRTVEHLELLLNLAKQGKITEFIMMYTNNEGGHEVVRTGSNNDKFIAGQLLDMAIYHLGYSVE